MNFTLIKTSFYLVFMVVLLIMALMTNDVFNSKLFLSVSATTPPRPRTVLSCAALRGHPLVQLRPAVCRKSPAGLAVDECVRVRAVTGRNPLPETRRTGMRGDQDVA